LQLTFWEYATNHTGEMFSLLMFAFVIWSLLEYRLDEHEQRLFLAAFAYGAGMANDWAMVCYFPVFLTALIWIRRLSFFNFRFFARMTLCGLAGALFYLLLPFVAAVSHHAPLTFWETLRLNLSAEFSVVPAFFSNGAYIKMLGLLSLSSLAPLLMMAIRWPASFGDTSRLGRELATWLFHFVHAVFLILCIWVAFDPPFSPREKNLGLTLYYLSALGVGYYSGYFLLVFRNQLDTRFLLRGPRFNFLNFLAVAVVWLLLLAAGAGLIYKNGPLIVAVNDETFQQYASLVAECLPRNGGMLLSDDRQRLYLTEAALTRDGRAKDFIFLDTESLVWPAYHKILHEKYPAKFPDTIAASETNNVSPLHIFTLLGTLAKTNQLYYLHPSFGYYFEEFYLKSHGLVYHLKTLPSDTLLPPLPDKDEIAENEAFWARAELQAFPPIERANAVSKPGESPSWGEQMLGWLRVPPERNLNALLAGNFYSRSLDYWGVELQRSGNLVMAAEHFNTAQKLYPDNAVAKINLEFNRSLQKGESVPLDPAKTSLDQFSPYNSWSKILNVDGPFDEPSFCFQNGLVWIGNGLYRQALAMFTRVCQLEPDSLPAHLWLAQVCDFNHLPDRALKVVQDVRHQPARFQLDSTNELQLSVIEAAAYFQKEELSQGTRVLETEISHNPTNDAFLATAAQFFMAKGLFTNALKVIDSRLQAEPDAPNWLFNKGLVCLQLKNYSQAINVFTRLLSLQADNATARFNRAIAYLSSDDLEKARADYEELNRTFTNSFRIDYGLGEIAWRQHRTNDAIRYYELYLANANTNTAEATNIVQRLRQLQGASR
ncbi:MAG TPA: tetratricopeptide repeat protein, partial [Verrucomicrobiae bacterium]|nr:tetratricopeptide repeat protein [Verrucomicrobiae bacterium]